MEQKRVSLSVWRLEPRRAVWLDLPCSCACDGGIVAVGTDDKLRTHAPDLGVYVLLDVLGKKDVFGDLSLFARHCDCLIGRIVFLIYERLFYFFKTLTHFMT